MSIAFDAALARRYQKPRCTPGNKNCGKRCIPQDYSCGSEEQKGDHPMAAQNLAKIEDEIRNKPIEYAAGIDPQTGREIFRSKGNRDSVDIPESAYSHLKGAIVTHNHPNLGNWPPSDPRSKGLSFSPADIHAASVLEMREIRAVSTGYNHSMVMPKKPINVEMAVYRHKGRIYRELAVETFFGKIDRREAQVEFWHRLWTNIAKDNPGMVYKRTEIKKDSNVLESILKRRISSRKTFDSAIPGGRVDEKKIEEIVKILLSRSYGSGIRAIKIDEIKDGKIKGRFSDKTRIMEFMISDKAVSTRMVKSLVRGDSVVIPYEDPLEEEDDRFDASKRDKRGIKCGKGWISARKTCQVNINQITTQPERKQLALALSSPSNTVQGGGLSPEDDPAASIRDLQAEGRKQGIPYTNRLSKDQLRDTIRAYKANPNQRESTYRALSKKRRAEESVGGSQFAKDWATANKILKLAGTGGVVSAVSVAAILANRTTDEIQRTQAAYADNFPAGANQARAKGEVLVGSEEPLRTEQHQALFVVGGATGEEGRAKDILEQMQSIAKEEGVDREKRKKAGETITDQDYPFSDYLLNENVTRIKQFDLTKTDFNVPDEEKFDKNGKYRPEYLARLGVEGVGLGRPDLGIRAAIIDRATGGKPKGGNEDAIDIAAQIYAHAHAKRPGQTSLDKMKPQDLWAEVKKVNDRMPQGSQFPVPSGDQRKSKAETAQARKWLEAKGWIGTETPNMEKPIRIVAYGHGGKAVKEAMELLHAMGPSGDRILEQVTVSYISTPDFNFTKQRSAKEASFVNNQDPFSKFSHRNRELVGPGTSGTPRSVENYFSSPRFRSEFSTWMGFGSWSAGERTRAKQAEQARNMEANDPERKKRKKEEREAGTPKEAERTTAGVTA